MKKLSILTLAIFLYTFSFAAAAAASDIPTASLRIEGEDLAAHPVGKQVKDYNERLQKISEDAQQYEPGSDSHKILKMGFEDLKREREKVGGDIRGLKGFQIELHGERAVGNPAGIKQAVIDYYIKNPDKRHMQPFHIHYNKDGKGPIIGFYPPNPDDIGKPESADTKSNPKWVPGTIIVPENTPPVPKTDDCGSLMGFCTDGQ